MSKKFKDFYALYGTYLITLVLGSLTLYLLIRRMARPIRSISATMEKIRQGSLTQRYSADPYGFEINILGQTFNRMLDNVLEKKQVAEEERIKRELLAQELKLGQQAQRSLLPQKMPYYSGIDIATSYIPAIEVGGDFYDAFVHDSRLILAVADAAGKGVHACFYSLSVRNMLRTYSKEYADIGEAVCATNNLFCQDTGDSGMFVTLIAAKYDHQTRILSYYSCGHTPSLILRANGHIEKLNPLGLALGIEPCHQMPAHSIQLDPGDLVLFYTDGITEACNQAFELFGEERLILTLKEMSDYSAEQCVAHLLNRVQDFVANTPQHDDITLIMMRILDV